MYAGGRFVGYEDGTVNWGSSPWSPWTGSPWGTRGSGRVRATWTSFSAGYATGHETWHRG